MKTFVTILALICIYSNPVSSQKTGVWKTLTTFSGTGNETTDDFYITTSKWRAVWTVEKQNSEWGVHFAAFVYNDDEMLEMMGNVMDEGSGKSVFRTKGSHYIKVNQAMSKWKIEIQEFIIK